MTIAISEETKKITIHTLYCVILVIQFSYLLLHKKNVPTNPYFDISAVIITVIAILVSILILVLDKFVHESPTLLTIVSVIFVVIMFASQIIYNLFLYYSNTKNAFAVSMMIISMCVVLTLLPFVYLRVPGSDYMPA